MLSAWHARGLIICIHGVVVGLGKYRDRSRRFCSGIRKASGHFKDAKDASVVGVRMAELDEDARIHSSRHLMHVTEKSGIELHGSIVPCGNMFAYGPTKLKLYFRYTRTDQDFWSHLPTLQ